MDISSLLEVQVNEEGPSVNEEVDEKPKIKPLRPSEIISPEEETFYQNLYGQDLAQVRFRKHHCTSCDVHIGSAPCDSSNMHEHPVLKTLLCELCREFYGDGTFEQGDDATDMFCRWCANGGNLYCCSFCSNTFCAKCIKRNFEPAVQDKIEADEKWKCFVCDPTDLYLLRANCRALIQHVKTLSRILMTDRSMSSKDVETKMEQDDSTCCASRKGRRKRKNSSSEEWKDDYRSHKRKKNGSSMKRRRTSLKDDELKEKKNVTVLNGTSRFIPISPSYVLQELIPTQQKGREDDELPPPLFQCEQTMIEGDSTSSKIKLPKGVPDSILTNSAISLNTIQRSTIIHAPPTTMIPPNRYIPIRPLRKIDSLPPGAKPQMIHKLTTRPNLPMVRIPAMGTIINNNILPSGELIQSAQQKNYIRCKSNLTTAPSTPSVIDIDSDPEELIIVEPSNKKTTQENSNTQSEESTPAAATSAKASSPKRSSPPTPPPPAVNLIQQPPSTELFDETIDNPIKKIDELLSKLRERLRLDLVKVGEWPEEDDAKAWRKVNIINQNINRVVNELAALNNSVVKQYRSWKNNQMEESRVDEAVSPIILSKHEKSSKYIPLDMKCTRESEPDSDDDLIDDIDIDNLVDFPERIININFKEKMNQSTNTKSDTKDQSVQVDDSVKVDYDKTISYSLLMKAEYDAKKKEEIFKPVIHDENFGKFEEGFINYLQNFEDYRNNVFQDDDGVNDTELIQLIKNDLTATTSTEATTEGATTSLGDTATSEATPVENAAEATPVEDAPEATPVEDAVEATTVEDTAEATSAEAAAPTTTAATPAQSSEEAPNNLEIGAELLKEVEKENKRTETKGTVNENSADSVWSWYSSNSETFPNILKSVNDKDNNKDKAEDEAKKTNNELIDETLNQAPSLDSWTSSNSESFRNILKSVNDPTTANITDDLLDPSKSADFSSLPNSSDNSNSMLINNVNDVEKSNENANNIPEKMVLDSDLDESNEKLPLNQDINIRNEETANAVRALISEENSNSCEQDHLIQ